MRRTHTRQPPCPTPIDWSNPITRDLHHVCTMAEGGKYYVATSLGVRQSDGVHTYAANGVSPNGRSGVFSTGVSTAAAGVNSGLADSIASTNEFTIVWFGRITGNGGSGAGRCYQGSGGGAHFMFYNAVGAKGIVLNVRTYTIPFSDNVDHLLIVTANTVGTTPVKAAYVDGIAQTMTDTGSGTLAATPLSGQFAWGNTNISGGIRVLAGNIILGMVARRIWTRAEIESISRNPWQVFRPPKRSIRVPTQLPQVAPILAQ